MTVELEKQGDVTVVTLVRPDVRNAVDGVTAQALHQARMAGAARQAGERG